MKSFVCYSCGLEHKVDFVGRQDSCSKCGRDLRVCRNCKHYDKSANNECREEQAGRQVEKEKGNFCEWFQLQEGLRSGGAAGKDDLRKAADALFKKKS